MKNMLFFAIVLGLAATPVFAAGQDAFTFIALGDMPYHLPEDNAKVDALIAAINKEKPAFTLHVGDIKSSTTPCSDEVLQKAHDQLQAIDGALVYAIGDNEWVDCHRKEAGGYDPRERLSTLRKMFFSDPGHSLGKHPLPLTSQGGLMPSFSEYVENARFEHRGVWFVSLHVPGSNNGFEAQDPAAAKEFFARDAANVAWLDDSFAKATEAHAKALVLFLQAEFDQARLPNGRMPRQSGFLKVLDAIERGAKAFKRPILLIHGDEHAFTVGALRNVEGTPIPGILNLMVMGDEEVDAVKVTVDTATPGVFGFAPGLLPH